MSFEFTRSHFNLVDERNKKKHNEQTGYDYSNPIYAIVEQMSAMLFQVAETSASLSSRTVVVNEPLVPTAGRTMFNNAVVVVTQQDVAAFSAAKPHLAAIGSKRIQITEILQAGNSILDKPGSAKPTTIDRENEGPDETTQNPSPEDVDETSDDLYKIRIIETRTNRVLQIKRFKGGQPEYEAWLNSGALGSRWQALSQSTQEGFKYDIVLETQPTKEKFIQRLKGLPSEVRVRVLDSNFFFEESITYSGSEFRTWAEENIDSVQIIIKSTDLDYEYDVTKATPNNKPVLEEVTFYEMPSHPPEPSVPTHEIISVTAWVMSHPDFDTEILHTLNKGDRVIVHDENVGKKGKWAKVTIPSLKIKGYTSGDYLKKLGGIKKTAPINYEDGKSFRTKKDSTEFWYKKRNKVPFYDPSDAKYKVNILTDLEHLPREDEYSKAAILEKYKESLPIGVETILKDNGKKHTSEIINSLIENDYYDNIARAEAYHLEATSGSTLRVLITVPHKHLALIDDMSEDDYKYDMYKEYPLHSFRENINKLSKKITSLQSSLDSYEGEVRYFDANEEGLRVMMLTDSFYEMMKKNNVKTAKGVGSKKEYGEKLGVGWSNGSLVYLSHITPTGEEKILKTGLEELKTKVHVSSKRTQNFLLHMSEIIQKGLKLGWVEFLSTYSNPTVILVPEDDDDKGDGKEGPIEKTQDQRISEEKYYRDKTRMKKKHEKRKKESDKTHNPKRYNGLMDVLGKAGQTSEDVYNSLVHNFDISRLAMAALACLNANPDLRPNISISADFSGINSDLDKITDEISKAIDDLVGVWDEPASVKYWDDLPTDDIVDTFFESLGEQLEAAAYGLIIGLVTSIINMVDNFCAETDHGKDLGPQTVQDSLPEIMPSAAKIADVMSNNPEYDKEDMSNFLTDLAAALTLDQYCRLLSGNPSDSTMSEVEDLLDRKYCKLGLDSSAEIKDFFKALGDTGSFDLCDFDEDNDNPGLTAMNISPWEKLCPPTAADLDERNRVLRAKGLSEEQVEQQRQDERDKAQALAKDIIDAFQNGLLSGNAESPPQFCYKDANGNIQPGTASFMDDTLRQDISETVDTLVKPVYDSFQKEGIEFSQSYIGLVDKTKAMDEYVDIDGVGEQIKIKRKRKVQTREPVPQTKKAHKEINIPPIVGSFNSSADQEVIFELPLNPGTEIQDAVSHFKQMEDMPNIPFLSNSQQQSMVEKAKNKLNSLNEQLNEKVRFKFLSACRNQSDFGLYWGALSSVTEAATQDVRVRINKNQDIVGTPAEEECEKLIQFSSLPKSLFSGIIIDTEIQQNSSSVSNNPGYGEFVGASNMGNITLTNTFMDNECEQEDKVYYNIQVIDKQITLEKEVTSLPAGLMVGTPYSGVRKYMPESFYHQNIKSYLPYAPYQAAFDAEDTAKVFSQTFEGLNKKIIKYLSDTISNSKYSNKINLPFSDDENPTYFVEMIDLGPLATPECDPHLLMLKELSDEAKSKFQDDYCNFTMEDPSKRDTPAKTPIESTMMRVCVKATLRHYLIDFYSRAIYSLTSFKGLDQSDFVFNYIIDKIMAEMSKYSWKYMRDFTRELSLLDGEPLDETTTRDLFKKMLTEEYNKIKRGYKQALCIDERRLQTVRESLAGAFKQIHINSEGVIEDKNGEFLNSLGRDIDFTVRDGDAVELASLSEYMICQQYYDSDLDKYFSFDEIKQMDDKDRAKEYELHVSLMLLMPHTLDSHNSLANLPGYVSFQSAGGAERVLETLADEVQRVQQPRIRGAFNSVVYRGNHSSRQDIERRFYAVPILQTRHKVDKPVDPEYMYYIKRLFTEDRLDTKMILDYAIPVNEYVDAMFVHEMELNSKVESIMMAFASTRDNLHNLFYTVQPEDDYWNKVPKALKDIPGGPMNLDFIFNLNFGLGMMPCTGLKWNLNIPNLDWGFNFPALNFGIAWKMARDAALMIFRDWAEKNDPNLILAKRLSFLTSLACVDISTEDYSKMLMIPFPGNPYMMNAINATYNFLGLGKFIPKFAKESDGVKEQLEENGFILPDYCNPPSEVTQAQAQQVQEAAQSSGYGSEQSVSVLLGIAGAAESINESQQRTRTQAILSGLMVRRSYLENQIRDLEDKSDDRYWNDLPIFDGGERTDRDGVGFRGSDTSRRTMRPFAEELLRNAREELERVNRQINAITR